MSYKSLDNLDASLDIEAPNLDGVVNAAGKDNRHPVNVPVLHTRNGSLLK